MTTEHIKVFTGSPILTRRLRTLLEEKNIGCIIKSDKIAGYEITNFIDEVFILNTDLEKGSVVVNEFKAQLDG